MLRLTLVLVLCACSPWPSPSHGDDRPDLLVLLADDLGYADVGFNGGKQIPTPQLDALAASGAVLECFYVQTVCTPTRASLLTGRYPIRYGLQEGVIRPGHEYGLPLAERTLSQALREAGYTTAISGKWHLGEYNSVYYPRQRGFDIQYGHFFGALDYTTHRRDGKLDWYRNDEPCQDEGYTTHLIAREAVRIVREQPREKPLFLYVPFNAVHSPYHTAPGRENDFPDMKPQRAEYATMLSEMDTAIGQILAALDETGRRKNAFVLFSSDNGGVGPASNGDLRGAKHTPYEGGHRVAACVSWPGRIKAGTRLPQPLHIVDLFPTFARLAGFSIEAAHQPRPLDGLDILPVLTESAPSPHPEILLGLEPTMSALRVGDWKLVHNRKPRAPRGPTQERPLVELFHLAEDPGEQTNLAEQRPEKLAELEARLAHYQREAIPPRGDPTGKVGATGATP
jgi:arylsulfatase A-like enzyme